LQEKLRKSESTSVEAREQMRILQKKNADLSSERDKVRDTTKP
jgi:hypothetical protein